VGREIWAIQSAPVLADTEDNQLQGVSCTSARACTAVGSYLLGMRIYYARAEHWNGQSWTFEQLPSPGRLDLMSLHSVSCTSLSACTAVGITFKGGDVDVALAEDWNGDRWTIEATP
jgi:hypothetical protein